MTRQVSFIKMNGLGNDFVIVDGRHGHDVSDPALIRQLSDRHFGIGCDQFIVLEDSKAADIFMRIYNPDGSESGACGNATRCVAHLTMERIGAEHCTIETIAGILSCRMMGDDLIQVDMGPPRGAVRDVNVDGRHGIAVDMGNPHVVFFVDDVSAIDLARVGPGIERDPQFPNRTNVEFVQVLDKNQVRARVWERGAGITLACGSGACAVGVAAIRQNLAANPVTVLMDGGPIGIEIRARDNNVLMTGGYTTVFTGAFLIDQQS